jgi:hypothetical protein
MDNPVKEALEFQPLPETLLLYRSKSDVCRNAKIQQLLQTPNINHNTKHLKRIEHDIDDILE